MPPHSADPVPADYESLLGKYDLLLKERIERDRQLNRLAILKHVALTINQHLDLSLVLPGIAEVVKAELEVRKLTLYEYDEDERTVAPMVGKHGDDLLTQDRFAGEQTRVENTPFAEAIESGRPVRVDTDYESAVYVPLAANEASVGVMLLVDREDGMPFGPENDTFYMDVALVVALAFNNARLYAQAVNDGLTKLFVRRYFDLKMEEMVEQAKRYDREFSMMMFDIDHFKKFNDTHGHQTGDKVLQQFASILEENTRNSDICCRYGGEEMTVILPETGLDKSFLLANKLCEKIRGHTFVGAEGEELNVTTSIGVGQFVEEWESSEGMLKAIDDALYRAKELGRNRVELARTGGDPSS